MVTVNRDALVRGLRVGMPVRYVPRHAEGNVNHRDCENGVVSEIKGKVVFVRYSVDGKLQETGKATPVELLKVPHKPLEPRLAEASV